MFDKFPTLEKLKNDLSKLERKIMEKIELGVVGIGFVGTALYHTFSPYFKMRLYDKYKPGYEDLETVVNSVKYLFVCVPTPVDQKGQQDINCVFETVEDINKVAKDSKIIILRSTVLPGTTRILQSKYKNHDFIFCPEFLTERTAILDSINAYRIILGGENQNVMIEVDKTIFRVKYPHIPIYFTTFEAAELVKYVGNCFFSVKIAFLNEVFEMCEKLGLEYNEVKKLLLSDQRITNSHMDVPGPDGYKGFGGKCFYKDLNSLMYYGRNVLSLEMNMLGAANKVNERVREKKDWLDIKGATTQNNYE